MHMLKCAYVCVQQGADGCAGKALLQAYRDQASHCQKGAELEPELKQP